MVSIEAADFSFVRDLVFARSAIVLGDDKHYLIESRLAPLAREFGFGTLGGIIRELRTKADSPLAERVVEALTTNETSWFRDIRPFEALREVIVPALIRARSADRRLSIWSAACSTGQEIYTVAMILEDFPELASWRVDLLGTDLNTEVLERARSARFSALEVNRGLPAHYLARHFTPDGTQFQLVDAIRRRVRFEKLNLSAHWPALPPFDVILMRNVLIYFDTETKRRILEAAHRQLTNHGYLMLGAAESTLGIVSTFTPVQVGGTVVYQR